MTKTLTRIAVLGFVLATSALTPFAKADEWDKKTVITTNAPIQIEGKVLEAGQHVIKLLDTPSGDRTIVLIYNLYQTKLEMMILGNRTYRLEPTGDSRFTLSEMPNGQKALRTWFYPGDNSGIEFTAKP